MSERIDRIEGESLLGNQGKILVITDDHEMRPGDTNIRANSVDNTIDIVLPSKAEAVNKMYFIHAPEGNTYDVSVIERENATEISTYGDLDDDDNTLLLYCSGYKWIVLESDLT